MGRGPVADRDPVRGAGPAQARAGVQVSVRAWLGLEGLRSGSEECVSEKSCLANIGRNRPARRRG